MSSNRILAGRAAIEAFLDDKQLNTDLKGMSTRLKTAGIAAAKAIAAATAAAMAAAGTYAIAQIRRNMTELDALGKKARTLDMRPTELMQLGYVARQAAGMTQESFESAYEYLQRGLQQAVSGAGKEFEALQKMGIDPETLIPLSATERIKLLSDGILTLGTHGEQVDATIKLFGRSNLEMINILKSGSQEVDRLAEKFAKLTGLDMDASTDAIERANDALDDMNTSWSALWTKMTLDNAEDIASSIELITEALTTLNRVTSDLTGGGLVPIIADLVAVMMPLPGLMARLSGNMPGDAIRRRTQENRQEGINDSGLSDIHKAGLDAANAVKRLGGSFEEQQAAAELAEAQWEKNADKMKEIAAIDPNQLELQEQLEKTVEKLQEQVQYWGMTAEEILIAKAAAGEAGEAFAGVGEELQTIRDTLSDSELSKSAQQMADDLLDAADAASRNAEQLREMREAQMLANVEAAYTAELAKGDEANVDVIARLEAAYYSLTDARIEYNQAVSESEEAARLQAANDSVRDLIVKYNELADVMAMSEQERFDRDIAALEAEGADPGEVAAARAAFGRHQRENQRANAQRIRDSQRTNQQIYDDELKKVQELKDQKLLTEEEFQREKAALAERHLREQEQRESRQRGGRGALGGFDPGILMRQLAVSGGDVVEQELKEHTKELKENNEHLASIVGIGNNVIRAVNAIIPGLNIPMMGGWRQLANIPMFRGGP